MPFQIQPLSPAMFTDLFALTDLELAAHRAVRVIADTHPGFPCRISLEDAAPGDELILVNHEHQGADSPYRSSHAVYARKGVVAADLPPNVLPPFFRGRLISLRAFDADGMIVGAELVEGDAAAPVIEAMLADPGAAYLHAHFAKYGCYAARIERA